MLSKFTIEFESKRKGDQELKTRRFSTHLLGYLVANGLWGFSQKHTDRRVRPVWIAYFGTEQELQPFTANFRAGRKSYGHRLSFEIPKKAVYRWVTQKVPGGAVTVAYMPDLVHLEAGAASERVRFLFAPPSWWVEQQAAELTSKFGDEAPDAARAALFVAYLDRRSPMPIVNDLRFHLRLWNAAREAKWTWEHKDSPSVLWGDHHPRWGIEDPLAVLVAQETLTQFLIDQTTLYRKEEKKNGTDRVSTDRWVLPDTTGALEQLCFNFKVA